jgi:DNA-directed RNA polymerase subunit RPC12/RpoP
MGLIIFGAVFGMMGGLGYNGYKNSKKIIERDSLITCPNCGSKLDISGDGNKKICNYCGSVF